MAATLTFTNDGVNATVTGRSSTGAEGVIIPYDDRAGHPVIAIANNAFNVLADQQELTSLDMSAATALVTIGASSFYSCIELTGALTIPNSVTSVGSYAFYECGFTGTLTLGSGLQTIGEGAFQGNYTLIGSLVIPNTVTTMGLAAFAGCRALSALTLPNNITTIEDYMFQDCYGFTGNLIIPDSVTRVGDGAFVECWGLNGTLTLGNNITSIGYESFAAAPYTGNLVIPNSVVSIGGGAFRQRNTAAPFAGGTLTIGSGLTILSDGIFEGNQFIGNLIIPNNIVQIGGGAFIFCNSFTSATLGTGVTSIGNGSFYDCTSLSSVIFNCSEPTLGEPPFSNVTATGYYYNPPNPYPNPFAGLTMENLYPLPRLYIRNVKFNNVKIL